ncbi:GNAT family N-acetyltransferase [Streptomyces sp. 71268]|uniref:GNAT family N-acetyltransferase n=1 Tax=Streptomyces sp. 71268 TaxID=3002640 RepID=UPI0023F9F254|nr:GNAT family N-acetyltransferase [Streptomyces sp. 71268]WEV29497.1 GNAT family N-acetyltransferase [Streptomyces sp. 71268]
MSSNPARSSRAARPSGSSAEPPATGSDLHTDRLVLRQWPADDLTAVVDGARRAHWADDFPGEGDRVIAGYVTTHPDSRGRYGQRQIIERETGLVVGAIGLFWPPTEGSLEFGYGVVASRRNRGYAAEAARALVAFALTAPGVHTVHATVELTNPASVRVLEKAGLRRLRQDATTVSFGVTTADATLR